MRAMTLRILRNSIVTALMLAVIGYMMSEFASMWLSSRVPLRPGLTPSAASLEMQSSGTDLSRHLRYQLPLTMALWGFLLVVVLELFVAAVFGTGTSKPVATPAKKVATINPESGLDPEVEQLLNNLLEQADAARAAEVKVTTVNREPSREPVREQSREASRATVTTVG